MRTKLYHAILVLLLILPASGLAQSYKLIDTHSYSWVIVSATGSTDIGRSKFQDYWDSSPAGGIRVITPFHKGWLMGSFAFQQQSAADDDLPDFLSVMGYGSWGFPMKFMKRTSLVPHADVGFHRMFFDEELYSDRTQAELELMLGAGVDILVPLPANWFGSAGITWLRTYTAEPIDMTLVNVGIGKRFNLPESVRTFLY